MYSMWDENHKRSFCRTECEKDWIDTFENGSSLGDIFGYIIYSLLHLIVFIARFESRW